MEDHIPLGKSIKTHLYWAMRNCEGNADNLKSLIDNIPSHYQVCIKSWMCSLCTIHVTYPGRPLMLPQLISLPHVAVHSQQGGTEWPTSCPATQQNSSGDIYLPLCPRVLSSKDYAGNNPHSTGSLYIQCRDTFTVESFNHMLLTYVPKRIHFSTKTFLMKMNLAVLDWVRYRIITTKYFQ